ncbi:MAG: LytTR family DNA-binding domain-containing protein [Lachnospiraceae bacterium]|nr:LytTR family DNA-binding domain-containing protein [Lachnospiraceae bacterium]
MYGLSVEDTSYHIAIVDDERKEGEFLGGLIKKYFERYPDKAYEVCIYQDGEQLMMELAEWKYFDLFFLDVEMEDQVNGIELAYRIHDRYLEPVIVYVTNHLECAPEAFEVNAFRFIPKRMLAEKIAEALDRALEKIDRIDQRAYVVDTPDCVTKILFKNIVFIQKDGKYINIHHRNGACRERKTLAEVMNALASAEFIYVDKSYVVNLRQIESIKKDQLVLKDGSILRISRPRYKKVREQLIAYWRREL